MASHRVVSVWIFARVEQKSNDLDMTEIRCQSKCQMAVLRVGARQQPTGIFDAPQVRNNPSITLVVTPHGGHCGFVGEAGVPPDDGYWAETSIVEFVRTRVMMASHHS